MTAIRLGLDIDGTITADPDFFAELSVRIRGAGGEVHIVTSRSSVATDATQAELRSYRIPFDTLHFVPDISRSDDGKPPDALDWYERFLWGKIAYAQRHRLTHFVDDDA